MVLQEKSYISKQKKKYMMHSCIWTAVVFMLFGAGLLLTGTRSNYFTVSACIMAIVAALFITRFISYNRFKAGEAAKAEILEQMKGDYHLFHSGIILDSRGTAYFEHLVVTARNVYLISYEGIKTKGQYRWLQETLSQKGIPVKSLHFLLAENEQQMKSIARIIEKDACFTDEKLDTYSKIISETLM